MPAVDTVEGHRYLVYARTHLMEAERQPLTLVARTLVPGGKHLHKSEVFCHINNPLH